MPDEVIQVPSIRVLIVVAETLFREALKWLIDAEPDLCTIAETGKTAEAAALVGSFTPDVVLLSVGSDGDELLVLREVLAAGSERTRVIVLGALGDSAATLRIIEAGAFGVLPRAADTAVLLDSIRQVARGQYWLGDRNVTDVVEAVKNLSQRTTRKPAHPFRLTPRELEVVAYVIDGYSNKDIAERCVVREDTVKHHLSSIFAKVGVRSRLELAMFAIQHGLIDTKNTLS